MMKKVLKWIGKVLLKVIAGFLLLSIISVILYRFIDPPVTPLMAIRYFEMEEGKLDYQWRDYEDISDHFKLAVIAAEDQKFLNHNGFDLESIEKAIDKASNGGKLRGASTISQQVAKNVFLWPSRSWVRKGFEMYFTFLIELFWSKERILEVYINIVELGKGVYGAQAASQEFFNRDALKITPSQAALLAAVLPRPLKYSARFPSSYVLKRQRWIRRQMQNLGSMDYLKKSNEL